MKPASTCSVGACRPSTRSIRYSHWYAPWAGGDGNYNVGRFSNPQIDALIERTKKETDVKLRTKLLTEALQASNNAVSHLPLHNQIVPWAMKKDVDVVHRADNRLDWRIIVVK